MLVKRPVGFDDFAVFARALRQLPLIHMVARRTGWQSGKVRLKSFPQGPSMNQASAINACLLC